MSRKGPVTIELQDYPQLGDNSTPYPGERHLADLVWRPQQNPLNAWLGLASLSLATISAIFIAVILVVTDQKAASDVNVIAPNSSILAVNAFANLMLVIGIGHGVLTLWWRRELRNLDGHAQTSPRRFGRSTFWHRYALIGALTSAVIKLLVVDSVLLPQLSSTFDSSNPQTAVALTVPSCDSLPDTALVSDATNVLLGASNPFQQYVVSPWIQSQGPYAELSDFFSGCGGTCEANFRGIGFNFDCTIKRTSADYSTQKDSQTSLPVFHTSFDLKTLSENGFDGVSFSGLYYQSQSSSDSCAGQIIRYSCKLKPARFNIDTTIYTSNSSSSSAGVIPGLPEQQTEIYYEDAWNMYGNQTNGWEFLEFLPTPDSNQIALRQLGGIQLALQQYLGSSANITHSDTDGWILSQSGWYASNQLSSTAATLSNDGEADSALKPGGCNYNYGDPTLDIVHRINNLALLLNAQDLAVANSLPTITAGVPIPATTVVTATQSTNGPHFQTNFPATYGVVATMILCVLMALPSYHGFWEGKGERVNLGTVEVTGNNARGNEGYGYPAGGNSQTTLPRYLQNGTVHGEHHAESSSVTTDPAAARYGGGNGAGNGASASTGIEEGAKGSSGGGHAHRRTTSTVTTLR